MLGIKVKTQDGIHHLSGHLDETTDFVWLAQVAEPIKLNMREIKSINSLGLRKFVGIVHALGAKQLEFLECSTAFIDCLNIMPMLVGGDAHIQRVKSLIVPYACPAGHAKDHVLETHALVPEDSVVKIPTISCPKCSGPMQADVQLEDHFAFLIDAAERA